MDAALFLRTEGAAEKEDVICLWKAAEAVLGRLAPV